MKYNFQLNIDFHEEIPREEKIKEFASRSLAEAFYPKLELRNIESTIVGDDLILLEAPKFRAECSIHAFDNKEMWEICSSLKHIKSALVGTKNRNIIPLLESVILKLDS